MKQYKVELNGKEILIYQDDDGYCIIPDEFRRRERFPSNCILECTCDEMIEAEEKRTVGRTIRTPNAIYGGGKGTNIGDNPGEKVVSKVKIHTNPECPCAMLDAQSGKLNRQGLCKSDNKSGWQTSYVGGKVKSAIERKLYFDSGGASRFFYCAKASRGERENGLDDLDEKLFGQSGGANQALKKGKDEYLQEGIGLNRIKKVKNIHPTVKPLALMEYLVKLTLMPNPNQIYLDPFVGCYDDKTEVLTNNGWKYFKDLDKNDLVASLECGELKFVKPLNYFEYEYKGEMICFKNRFFDLKVTPDHRMFIQKRNGEWVFKPAKEVRYNEKLLACVNNWKGENINNFSFLKKQRWEKIKCNHKDSIIKFGHNKKGKQVYYCKICNRYFVNLDQIDIDAENILRFLGIYLAEGYINKKTDTIFICQKNYKNEVEKILKDCGFVYNYNKTKFRISNKNLIEYLEQFGYGAKNKKIIAPIKNLNRNLLKHLLYGLMLGDGTYYKGKTSFVYNSISKQLADDVQEILLKLGYVSFISQNKLSSGNIIYRVNANLKSKTPKVRINQKTVEYYEDKVYCVEVPSHIILVRRNGKAVWCGNSGTTLIAVKKLGRNFIGIEKEPEYVEIAKQRIGAISDSLFKLF